MPGIGDLLSPLRDGVIAINNLGKTLNTTFARVTGYSNTATVGALTFNSSQPAGFTTILTASGTTLKVPFYNP